MSLLQGHDDPDEYRVRTFEPGDREGFLDLYASVWGREKSEAWFEWRFEENPYRDGVQMVVAEYDGRVVGAEPLLPLRVRAGAVERLAFQPADWIVHADHRRRGVFTRMTRRLLEAYGEEAALLFNFPTDALLPGLRQFDWHVLGPVPSYLRVQRPSALLSAAATSGDLPPSVATAAKAADPVVRAYREVRDRLARGRNEVSVERHRRIPAAALVDVYETGPADRIHVTRDEAFYRWRFANPAWETTAYLARTGGGPVAGAIVATERYDGVVRTCVLDVQPAEPGAVAERALAPLLGRVVADHRDADVLKLSGTGLPTGTLGRYGFRRASTFPLSLLASEPTLAVRPLPGGPRLLDGRDPTDRSGWSLALADQDVE